VTEPDSASRPAKPNTHNAAPAEPSIGTLAKDASTHLSTIIRGEIELAKAEVTSSVKNAGAGVVLFLAAAVILVFSLTFGLIALAEGLTALWFWRWAAYLLVFALLVLTAAACVWLGVRKVKSVKAPQRTIETTKDTAAYLRHPTQTPPRHASS
jgi:uncharacterized membrane protein YqjE